MKRFDNIEYNVDQTEDYEDEPVTKMFSSHLPSMALYRVRSKHYLSHLPGSLNVPEISVSL